MEYMIISIIILVSFLFFVLYNISQKNPNDYMNRIPFEKYMIGIHDSIIKTGDISPISDMDKEYRAYYSSYDTVRFVSGITLSHMGEDMYMIHYGGHKMTPLAINKKKFPFLIDILNKFNEYGIEYKLDSDKVLCYNSSFLYPEQEINQESIKLSAQYPSEILDTIARLSIGRRHIEKFTKQ